MKKGQTGTRKRKKSPERVERGRQSPRTGEEGLGNIEDTKMGRGNKKQSRWEIQITKLKKPFLRRDWYIPFRRTTKYV